MVDRVSVELMECHVTRISHDILRRNEEGEKEGRRRRERSRKRWELIYIYEGMGMEDGGSGKGKRREGGEKTSTVLLQMFGK